MKHLEKYLVIGSTGLAGQAFVKSLSEMRRDFITLSRQGADVCFDVTDRSKLAKLLDDVKPDIIINCAAIVDIDLCEEQPLKTWLVNTELVAVIADWCKMNAARLVHISTDHYYDYGGGEPHSEDDRLVFFNNYARQKYSAELAAASLNEALILRTSITGIRGIVGRKTLWEWVIEIMEKNAPANLFYDAFTSTIDVEGFAKSTLDLIDLNAHGVINLAAHNVYSKYDFVIETAKQLGIDLTNISKGSVSEMTSPRPPCLGLDVSKAEQILGYQLPSMRDVVSNLLAQQKSV